MNHNGFSKILLVLLASFLLSACATQAGYRKICESWVGAPCDKLIRSWGPPHDIMRLDDGSRLFVWKSYTDMKLPYTGWQTAWCETQFECSPQGRIVAWSFKGNDCVGKYKEEPKLKTLSEQKIELTEGETEFRKDVVETVVAYYNSRGLAYSEETLVSAIKMAESISKYTYNDEVKNISENMVKTQTSQVNEMKDLMEKIK